MTDQEPKENLFAKMISALGKFLEAFADFVKDKPLIATTLVGLLSGGLFTGLNTWSTASAHDHKLKPEVDTILTLVKIYVSRSDDFLAHQIADEGIQERMPGYADGKRKYDSALTKFHRDSLDLHPRHISEVKKQNKSLASAGF